MARQTLWHNGATRTSVNSQPLTVTTKSENAHVTQFPENGKPNQQWRLTAASGGGYTLRNSHSLKCLTPLGGGTAIGTPVVQATCTGTTAQRWTFPLLTGVTHQIRSVSSGRCVEPSGPGWADLALAACSLAEPAQQWTSKRVG